MNKKSLIALTVIMTTTVLVFVFMFISRLVPGFFIPIAENPIISKIIPGSKVFKSGIKNFSSEQDFKSYLLDNAGSESNFSGGLSGRSMAWEEAGPSSFNAPMGLALPSMTGMGGDFSSKSPARVSGTNIQVLGIDEPDILKTDGKEIYYSGNYYYSPQVWSEAPVMNTTGKSVESMPPPQRIEPKLQIIKAFPPASLSVINKIDKRGNLILSGNMLVVFAEPWIYGYDVSDPKNPQEKWKIELKESNIVSTRLYKDKIYLVSRSNINDIHPCPIMPMTVWRDNQSSVVSISCERVYHPEANTPVDVTYNALTINPRSGETTASSSFVGSSGKSIVYMSEDAVYITYSYQGDFVGFMLGFFRENEGMIPKEYVDKLARLEAYDISASSKMSEVSQILNRYTNSLSQDERMKFENEAENKMNDYMKNHIRELQKTGIIKLNAEDYRVLANGVVPGDLLNQYSLDEYNGNLRVAVTVGEGWFSQFGGSQESANDVYVLDKNLQETGSIKDLGLKEKIYSARFIGNRGYLVTFRQIDPFYVMDLTDAKNPQLKGELKIPGYSGYLHPVGDNRILGIGEESGKLKASLFDVSSPDNPVEKSKYILADYHSDVLYDYHAFLNDPKHKAFFIPGTQGGYILSYNNDTLTLKKAVSEIQAKRALYLNDYLYIVGDNKIVVVNEADWETVNQLDLSN